MITITVIGGGDKYLRRIFRDFSSPMVDAMAVAESSEAASGYSDHRRHLKPFTSESARAAALKSVEVRKAKALARKTDAQLKDGATVEALGTLRDSFDREDLGPTAAAFAQWLMAAALKGDIKVAGKDLAPLLKTLVDIARLEAGEATSHTAVAHVSATADQVLGQIQQMTGNTTSSG